jgi:hypothetical protein
MIYAPTNIIPNGALINGVCHIYQSARPTARPDGSALVVGDKWYNTATGVEGFWNGTYWLAPVSVISSGRFDISATLTGTAAIMRAMPVLPNNIFIYRIKVGVAGGVGDSTNNYWNITPGYHSHMAASFSALATAQRSWAAGMLTFDNINTALLTTTTMLQGIDVTKVGTPSNIIIASVYYLSEIL